MKTKLQYNFTAIYQTLLVIVGSSAWTIIFPRYAPFIGIGAVVLSSYHDKPTTIAKFITDTKNTIAAVLPVLPKQAQDVILAVEKDVDAIAPLVEELQEVTPSTLASEAQQVVDKSSVVIASGQVTLSGSAPTAPSVLAAPANPVGSPAPAPVAPVTLGDQAKAVIASVGTTVLALLVLSIALCGVGCSSGRTVYMRSQPSYVAPAPVYVQPAPIVVVHRHYGGYGYSQPRTTVIVHVHHH